MNADRQRRQELMRIFHRLQTLHASDPTWFPIEPEPGRLGRLRLSREVVEKLLDDLPVWAVAEEGEGPREEVSEGPPGGAPDVVAVERSMQLQGREEGLVVLLFLSHALVGGEEPVRFRAIWEEHRLTLRLWAAGGGVTDSVLAVALSLEATLFPLHAPAEVRQTIPGFDAEPG